MDKPETAWFGPAALPELERLINVKVPHERRTRVWQALAPLLAEPPEDDADWLCRVRVALDPLELGGDAVASLSARLAKLVSEHRWCELKRAVAHDWPDHSEQLDDSQALGRLQTLAGQATCGLSANIRDQAIDNAPSQILRAFPRFDNTRPFNPWARTVLRRHAINLLRSQRSQARRSLPDDVVSPPFSPTSEDDLAHALHEFRQLFDLAQFPPSRANGPDRYAAFALEVRLRLAEYLVNYAPDFLNLHLPLRTWERPRRVLVTWPRLGDLWDWAVATQRLPQETRCEFVQRGCATLAPALGVTALQIIWSSWVHRAKDKIRERFASPVQEALYFHLFPDHSGSQEETP